MNTAIELNEQKRELISQLRIGNKKDYSILNQIRQIEQEIKQIERLNALNHLNNKYSKLRELAAKVWQCEQPRIDIFCNDGSLHKTKAKNYPILSSLPYVRGKYKNGVLLDISTCGESFQMFKIKYEYGKPDEYTRPQTFEEFLYLNSIPRTEISLQEFEEMETRLNTLNEALKIALNAYSKGLEDLNASSLRHWGYLGQNNEHLYKTDLKF